MVRIINSTIEMAVLMIGAMILSVGGVSSETTNPRVPIQISSDSEATRIVYGTVDDVARNLVKVNQDKTEGISPRYLDLSEAEKKGAIKKGDQVKMKVNHHNMVIDYWIIEEK